jgi:hypothetical protein
LNRLIQRGKRTSSSRVRGRSTSRGEKAEPIDCGAEKESSTTFIPFLRTTIHPLLSLMILAIPAPMPISTRFEKTGGLRYELDLLEGHRG